MSDPFVVLEPAKPLILLEDEKRHLRVSDADHDVEILRLIERATFWCQNYTRRKFLSTGMEWSFTRFTNPIPFSWSPLEAVTDISYVDVDGNPQTVTPTVYEVRTNRIPGEIILQYQEDWPTDVRDHDDSITVSLTVGYGSSPDDVPQEIRQAVTMLAGYWFETGMPALAEPGLTASIELPFTVKSLLDQYKVLTITV